jgi:hypothetical protein
MQFCDFSTILFLLKYLNLSFVCAVHVSIVACLMLCLIQGAKLCSGVKK